MPWPVVDAPFLIRVGAGLVFALLGAFLLWVRGRPAGTTLYALHVLLFGLGSIARSVENAMPGGDGTPRWSTNIVAPSLYIASGVLGVAALVRWRAPMSSHAWKALAVPLGWIAFTWVLFWWTELTLDPPAGPAIYANAGGMSVYMAAATMACIAGERLRKASGNEARTLAALAVGTPLLSFFHLGEIAILSADSSARNLWTVLAIVAGFVVAALWLMRGARAGRPAMLACWALLGLMLFGMLVMAITGEQANSNASRAWLRSLSGLVRLAGATVLAYALFRADLAGAPLPSVRAHAGAVAIGFLVVLFAFAQVLESAVGGVAGLGIGAVVALVSVFVGPRIEGLVNGRGRRTANEATYRDALRIALRDRRLSADEERQLMVLADRLGIRATRAYELRDEVVGGRT